ncbi:MAG: hypothetical protein U0527_17820 [Candidatus Eisenbacteria bacterium]
MSTSSWNRIGSSLFLAALLPQAALAGGRPALTNGLQMTLGP